MSSGQLLRLPEINATNMPNDGALRRYARGRDTRFRTICGAIMRAPACKRRTRSEACAEIGRTPENLSRKRALSAPDPLRASSFFDGDDKG